eukprot:Skav227555  [mRNA]  locus=scaffold3241:116126:119269:- [translate_table: standard]
MAGSVIALTATKLSMKSPRKERQTRLEGGVPFSLSMRRTSRKALGISAEKSMGTIHPTPWARKQDHVFTKFISSFSADSGSDNSCRRRARRV